jgi:hypothetical protein
MTSYIEQLDAFVASRPGFDPANYSDRASYAADRRVATQAAADYRLLRLYVAPTDEALASAAHGSRVTFGADGVEYCTGQYYPTEYRAAACRLLARAWWERTAKQENRTAESLRAYARVLFGRAIARRWFS